MRKPTGERPLTERSSILEALPDRREPSIALANRRDASGEAIGPRPVRELALVGPEPYPSGGDGSPPPGRLAAALWRRSAETSAHQARIARIAERLAREMGWTEEERRALEVAASMHDIGKLAVPRRVLHKPGPLGPIERKIVQTHTILGALLLHGRPGAWVRLARSIALHHHERWDGSGYPRGLAGDAIPAAARIVAVADVYDALTHRRIYRPAFPESRAVAFMRTQRGRHFDSAILDCFLDLLPGLRRSEGSPKA